MSRQRLFEGVVVALAVAGLAGGAGPLPRQRVLRGEDARKAQELEKRVAELRATGKFAAAVEPAEAVRDLRRRVQGKDHWETADAAREVLTLKRVARLPAEQQRRFAEAPGLVNRAYDLCQRGKYAEAEALFRKALAIYEEVLGPRHPDTAIAYQNLATSLGARGKYAQAEELLRKALAVFEEVLGPRHPHTAVGYNNLAGALAEQGKHAEVEPLLRKALAVAEEALGPRHPLTAAYYNNLADNLDRRGRHAEAEPLFRKSLALWLEELGPRAPHTLHGYNTLALNLDRQGRHAEAEPLFRKALAVRKEVLGRLHPDTATSYNNLALNLYGRGKYAEAEPLFREALAIREEVLGPRHPDTATSYNNLAGNLDRQGKHAEAGKLLRKALGVRKEVLGPGHPSTTTSYNNLAIHLDALGKEAERYLRSAVASYEVSRLRLASTGFDRAAAARGDPHLGLAVCLAQAGKPTGAWRAAEAGLARGLLDDLTSLATGPAELRRLRERAARLERLDQLLLPLLTAPRLDEPGRRRRDALLGERAGLLKQVEEEAAERARREVYSLERIQKHLPPDAALVFWLDLKYEIKTAEPGRLHWGCVVRRSGAPAWVRLPGTGPGKSWTDEDVELARGLRAALSGRSPGWARLARRLAAQRLAPLESHLAATGELPAARRLVVVPVGWMAGVPVEALTDSYRVSYAPSGTVIARLARTHRPLRDPSLLALGDPAFHTPDASHSPEKAEALRAATRGPVPKPLPGSRREVTALAALFPRGKALLLLGPDASEQRLDELAAAGRLKDFRLLHFATHGQMDPDPSRSALLLAGDRLPDAAEQARKGKKVYTGRLTVQAVARWQLDADLVVLSACESGLGRNGGGEGFLGFAQVFFQAGARSLVLSQWKVDDAATALLMARFYENLLGKRDGLKAPLGRSEALREAQRWLRTLPRSQAEALTARLSAGALRGTVGPLKPPVKPDKKEGRPYAHPYYWAAFILVGDPR